MTGQIKESPGVDTVGLIPAAGLAKRIGPLPYSKEVFPVWWQDGRRSGRPRAVCEVLLANMRSSGIRRAHIILRKGKWDIPAHLGPGESLGMSLSYLIMGLPHGVPFTLDQAYPYIHNERVALGFPDIVFHGGEAFSACMTRQEERGADIVLGAFPTPQQQGVDMVDVADEGVVRRIVIKPAKTNLQLAWAIAVWTPVFTEFMHGFLKSYEPQIDEGHELFLGNVMQAAIDRGMRVEAVQVSRKPFLDIGTPEGLERSLTYFRDERA